MIRLAAIVVLANAILWWVFAYSPSPDQLQHDQQEALLRAAIAATGGLPAIKNFEERKMMKRILEMRDQVTNTTTYIVDMNGHPHKICDSIGYGFPLSTQFTNPSQNPRTTVVLSQAEPNGLFSSPTSEGTWISCVDPGSKDMRVVYVEPRVIVSPFPLPENLDEHPIETGGDVSRPLRMTSAGSKD